MFIHISHIFYLGILKNTHKIIVLFLSKVGQEHYEDTRAKARNSQHYHQDQEPKKQHLEHDYDLYDVELSREESDQNESEHEHISEHISDHISEQSASEESHGEYESGVAGDSFQC